MAFDEIRFPENISFGAQGGAEYSTDIIELYSGFEKRNVNWALPRMKYNVSHILRDKTAIAVLLAFFRARKGKANGFRFKDWADYTALGQNLGVGDGVCQDFQLRKAYVSGAVTEYRSLNKVVVAAEKTPLAVYLNGVLKVLGTHYTVDYNSGLVSFVTAPAVGVVVSADCEFDVPVRFDLDYLPVTIDNFSEYSVPEIRLVEVRV